MSAMGWWKRGVWILGAALFCPDKALAQKRNMHWLTYSNALGFHQQAPQNLGWAPLTNTISAYSDTSGQLLAHAGSTGIRGSSQQLMANHPAYPATLLGANLTQSPIFIPKPSDGSHAYFVYNRQLPASATVIGMIELDLAAQAVVDTGFTWFMPNAAVKRAGVPHSNGIDYWFVAQPRETNAYHAFLITATGLDTVPVVSLAGTIMPPGYNKNGKMIANVAGDRLITVHAPIGYDYDVELDGLMDLVAFDQQNGQINLLHTFTGLRSIEGVEFSPNGRYLYVSEFHSPFMPNSPWQRDLYQYDLEAADIDASRVVVHSNSTTYGFHPGANTLALAPDGRIYRGTYSEHILTDTAFSMIPEPDLPAPACGFVLNAFEPTAEFSALPSPMKRYHDDINIALSATQWLPDEQLRAFPNPATESIRLHGLPSGARQVIFRDALGRVARTALIPQGYINIGALAIGSYVIEVRDANGMRLGTAWVMKE